MIKLLLRLGFRNLIKQRLYTLINISGLTIGLLSFFLILLYVTQEKSFDKFNEKSKRIYRLTSATNGNVSAIVPYAWGQPMKDEIAEIENLASFQNITIALTVKKDENVYAQHGFIGADSTFLDIFDYPALKGNRTKFLKSPNKMVITTEMADKYFKGEDPIGKTLQVNLWGTFVTYEVEGIIDCPKNSHIQFNFLIPIHLVKKHFFSPAAFESWTTHFCYTYLLMVENFDPPKVNRDFKVLLERHGGKKLSDRRTPGIEPLEDIYLKSNIRFDFQPRGDNNHIQILMVVGIGILIMAIINFININSALSLRRLKETGLRKILGSKKKSLIFQFMAESSAISLVSMFLAVLALLSLLPYFNDFTGTAFTLSELLSFSNFLAAFSISISVGVLSSFYPALILSSFKPTGILSSRSTDRSKTGMARKVLVVVQFTLAVLLLIATGIIYEQVNYMRQKDLGFNKDQVIVLRNARSIASSPSKTQLLRETILNYDGIQTVSASSSYPGDEAGHWASRIIPDGFEQNESVSLWTMYADHDFASTYGLEIIQGRDFDRNLYSDSIALLINEAAVELFSNNDASWLSNPLNKSIQYGKENEKGIVIGVIRNFHFESLKEQISPLVVQINAGNFFSIQIKLNTGNIAESIAMIESDWKRLFPEVPLSYNFLDQEFAILFESDQKLGKILRIFSILSVVIAVLGLFGLATFLALQKAREMSIRKVMGASESQLTILLSWHFLKLVVVANLIAIPSGYILMSKWLEEFAYRTHVSISVFVMATGLCILVAILTIGQQAYRTATTNPVDVLNQE